MKTKILSLALSALLLNLLTGCYGNSNPSKFNPWLSTWDGGPIVFDAEPTDGQPGIDGGVLDAGGHRDASRPHDAGFDDSGGPPPDGGFEPDAGFEDDAGFLPDSGPDAGPDAGPPADGGDAGPGPDAGDAGTPCQMSLDENFELLAQLALDGQGGWSGNTNFDVQTAISQDGMNAAGFTASVNQNVFVRHSIPPASNGSQVFYMMAAQDSAVGGIQFGSNVSTNEFNLAFRPFGVLAFYNGTVWVQLATYQSNQWYRIEVEWRNADSKFRVRVDNDPWSTWDRSVSTSWTTITDIALNSNGRANGTGQFFWDTFIGSCTTP